MILNPADSASDVFFYFMKAPSVTPGDADEQLNSSVTQQPIQFTPGDMEFGVLDSQGLVQLNRVIQEVMLPLSNAGGEVWGNLVTYPETP